MLLPGDGGACSIAVFCQNGKLEILMAPRRLWLFSPKARGATGLIGAAGLYEHLLETSVEF